MQENGRGNLINLSIILNLLKLCIANIEKMLGHLYGGKLKIYVCIFNKMEHGKLSLPPKAIKT